MLQCKTFHLPMRGSDELEESDLAESADKAINAWLETMPHTLVIQSMNMAGTTCTVGPDIGGHYLLVVLFDKDPVSDPYVKHDDAGEVL